MLWKNHIPLDLPHCGFWFPGRISLLSRTLPDCTLTGHVSVPASIIQRASSAGAPENDGAAPCADVKAISWHAPSFFGLIVFYHAVRKMKSKNNVQCALGNSRFTFFAYCDELYQFRQILQQVHAYSTQIPLSSSFAMRQHARVKFPRSLRAVHAAFAALFI